MTMSWPLTKEEPVLGRYDVIVEVYMDGFGASERVLHGFVVVPYAQPSDDGVLII